MSRQNWKGGWRSGASGLPGVTWVVVAGLILMVGLSAAQFARLERTGRPYFSAFHARDTDDIRETSWREDPNSASRYGLFYALDSIAPGSTVWIGAEDPATEDPEFPDYLAERFYAYGGVEAVRTFDGSTLDVLGDVDAFEHAIADTKDGAKVAPWVISVESPEDPIWPSEDYLRKLFAGVDVDSYGALEFVVVRWPHARAGSDWDYQWLLVDTRLLADGSWNP